MSRVHKNEMTRWANSEENTGVWYKTREGDWKLLWGPVWLTKNIYIVDDEHAELRKQFIDDPKKIEVRYEEQRRWIPTVTRRIGTFTALLESNFRLYRIKPKKPTYEWQWISRDEHGYYLMTFTHFTEAEMADKDVVKFHASKRIVDE